MLEITKQTAIISRIQKVQKALGKKPKTKEEISTLIEKDLPWLIGALGAHHQLFRKFLLLASGGGKGMGVYDIHTINPKMMDAALSLYQPSKAEVARLEKQKKEDAAEADRIEKAREQAIEKLGRNLADRPVTTRKKRK